MAMYIVRKFVLNADKKMSIILVFILVFIRIHIGSANDDTTHLSIVSDSEKSFPGEKYYVLNNTENEFTTAGTRSADTARTGEGTPSSPCEPTADSVGIAVTDMGLLFDDDKSSVARFIPSLTTDCQKLLQDYAVFSSDFMYCTLAFAKPLLFCETCIAKFVETNRIYHEIERTKDCSDSLLSSDRVQILRETHNFLKRLWDKGSCKNCFQDMKACEDGKAPCSVTEDVLKFQKYNNQTLNCFEEATASSANVCTNCSGIYKTLSKFYISMGNVEEVCIDCVEQMNSTRKEWSIVYNCTYSRRDVVSIVAISVFFCSLPVFFYFGSKVHTVKSEYKLLKQSRLKKPHRPIIMKLPTLPEHGEAFLTEDSTANSI